MSQNSAAGLDRLRKPLAQGVLEPGANPDLDRAFSGAPAVGVKSDELPEMIRELTERDTRPAYVPPPVEGEKSVDALDPAQRDTIRSLVEEARQWTEPQPTSDSLNDQSARTAAPSENTTSDNLCPNCRWDLSVRDVVSVTDEDREMWIRHILGEDRFIKRYDLYGGRLTLVFRSAVLAELDALGPAIEKLMARIPQQNDNNLFLARLGCQVRLLPTLTLQDIRRHGSSTRTFNTIYSTGLTAEQMTDRIIARHDELLNGMGENLARIILDTGQQFDQLCSRLRQLKTDDSFFGPSGSGP